jgi:hypothetical protein
VIGLLDVAASGCRYSESIYRLVRLAILPIGFAESRHRVEKTTENSFASGRPSGTEISISKILAGKNTDLKKICM